jgi:hypothetical protein
MLSAMTAQPPITASPQETLDDLVRFSRQRRTLAPLRRAFLQAPGKRNTPGPMHLFVSGRRDLAFDLYLLLHCGAAAKPWDVALPAMAWARALDRPQTLTSETTVSKNWTWLEQQGLVRSERFQRLRKVYLLREDGSGQEYTRPTTGEAHGYFQLPFAFFTERWHKKLTLRAKATLLICLAQKPPFELRTEHATERYGLSPDSMQRGLDELRAHGLLTTTVDYRRAPRARLGFTLVHLHELKGDLAKPARKPLGKVRGHRKAKPKSSTAKGKAASSRTAAKGKPSASSPKRKRSP